MENVLVSDRGNKKKKKTYTISHEDEDKQCGKNHVRLWSLSMQVTSVCPTLDSPVG